MTPAPKEQSRRPESASDIWRDIVQSGADSAQIEGFTLEQLMDFKCDRASPSGEGR